MKFNPAKHHRRSIRLKDYDYSSQGYYYITICLQNRECLLGDIRDGELFINEYGKIAQNEWLKTANIRNNVELDDFVIMPNHIHGILVLTDDGRGTARRIPTTSARRVPTMRRIPKYEQFGKPVANSIPTIIRSYKSAVTKHFNQLRKTPGASLWQRNYYEHIIRDEEELNRIRKYIRENPYQWFDDKENPDN